MYLPKKSYLYYIEPISPQSLLNPQKSLLSSKEPHLSLLKRAPFIHKRAYLFCMNPMLLRPVFNPPKCAVYSQNSSIYPQKSPFSLQKSLMYPHTKKALSVPYGTKLASA